MELRKAIRRMPNESPEKKGLYAEYRELRKKCADGQETPLTVTDIKERLVQAKGEVSTQSKEERAKTVETLQSAIARLPLGAERANLKAALKSVYPEAGQPVVKAQPTARSVDEDKAVKNMRAAIGELVDTEANFHNTLVNLESILPGAEPNRYLDKYQEFYGKQTSENQAILDDVLAKLPKVIESEKAFKAVLDASLEKASSPKEVAAALDKAFSSDAYKQLLTDIFVYQGELSKVDHALSSAWKEVKIPGPGREDLGALATPFQRVPRYEMLLGVVGKEIGKLASPIAKEGAQTILGHQKTTKDQLTRANSLKGLHQA